MVFVGSSGIYDVSRFAPKAYIKDGVCVGIGVELDLVNGKKVDEFFELKVKTSLNHNMIVALCVGLAKKTIIDNSVLSFSTNEIASLEEILKGGSR